MANFPTVQGMGGSLQAALTEKSKVQFSQGGNVQHVRYDSYSGDWSYGKDNEDLTGEIVTIITNSFVHGWHLWVDREVTKNMVSFTMDKPEKPEAREDRKGKVQTANEARGFQCIMGGGDDSVQMSWEHSTDGCRRAIDEVLETTMARALKEAEYLYPVVKLTHDTPYENSYKDGEMIYPPKLEIVGWRNKDGEDAPPDAERLEDKKYVKEDETVVEDKKTDPTEANEEEEKEATEETAQRRQRRRRKSAA